MEGPGIMSRCRLQWGLGLIEGCYPVDAGGPRSQVRSVEREEVVGVTAFESWATIHKLSSMGDALWTVWFSWFFPPLLIGFWGRNIILVISQGCTKDPSSKTIQLSLFWSDGSCKARILPYPSLPRFGCKQIFDVERIGCVVFDGRIHLWVGHQIEQFER